MKRALITGITGQDGAYLAEFLLQKGYHVTGAKRRSASGSLWRLDALNITDRVEIKDVDLTDAGSCVSLVSQSEPDEIYNLAAQSFVAASFDQPIATGLICYRITTKRTDTI
jgi:GDPmannose 4,6-dehydratase